MATSDTVIAEAFGKFHRSISVEDAHTFASTTLSDVWATVRDIEKMQRKGIQSQNLRRLEPLLRGIERFTKVAEIFCNGTYLPYIWVRPHFSSLQKTSY